MFDIASALSPSPQFDSEQNRTGPIDKSEKSFPVAHFFKVRVVLHLSLKAEMPVRNHHTKLIYASLADTGPVRVVEGASAASFTTKTKRGSIGQSTALQVRVLEV